MVATLVALLLLGVVGCHHAPSLSGPVTSRDDAIARVTALPDVAAWIRLVEARSPGNQVVIDIDSEDATTYTVHAYELVQDELGGHSATFGWYEVTRATGVVRSVLP
jgi:hypothetical protein